MHNCKHFVKISHFRFFCGGICYNENKSTRSWAERYAK